MCDQAKRKKVLNFQSNDFGMDDAKNSFVAGLEIRRNILLTLEFDSQF
jgi:hypothetical protein